MQLLCVGEVLRETWGEVCTEDALILVREERESLLVSFPGFFREKLMDGERQGVINLGTRHGLTAQRAGMHRDV